MATRLDGKKVSADIKAEIALEVSNLLAAGHRKPHLAAVLVGHDGASHSYVNSKIKDCAEVGFDSSLHQFEDISEADLLDLVAQLNADDGVDGYIVQLPLPDHIDDHRVLMAIDPKKDVDGFHPANYGRMALGLPSYVAATPLGITELIKRYNIETSGKSCLVIGRSHIVGSPISILLGQKGMDCTVTMANSRTPNLAELCQRADIVVAATGRPESVGADMIKEGAVVIDVGTTRVEDASRDRGWRLAGDVRFKEVEPKASYITPVPGGVGPMTRSSLLMNTLKAAKKEIYP